MLTDWFIVYLPVLIILGALFSPLDWFLLHLVTLFLWPSIFLIKIVFIYSSCLSFLLHTHLIKYSFTHKIIPFKQMLTVNMFINILSFFIDPNVKIFIWDFYFRIQWDLINIWENRMSNLERVATWGTQSTGQNTNNRKHTTYRKLRQLGADSTTQKQCCEPRCSEV